MGRSFAVTDDIFRQRIIGISEIIVRNGIVNVDLTDIKSIMTDAESTFIEVRIGSGKIMVEDAAAEAISSSFLDVPIEVATSVVMNILGSEEYNYARYSSSRIIYLPDGR